MVKKVVKVMGDEVVAINWLLEFYEVLQLW